MIFRYSLYVLSIFTDSKMCYAGVWSGKVVSIVFTIGDPSLFYLHCWVTRKLSSEIWVVLQSLMTKERLYSDSEIWAFTHQWPGGGSDRDELVEPRKRKTYRRLNGHAWSILCVPFQEQIYHFTGWCTSDGTRNGRYWVFVAAKS